MATDIIKGIIVGLFASIPLGPVGILCIQRTLSKGKFSGLFTGLGTAVADTIFAAIALLSLTIVDDFLNRYREWVYLLGGIIVIGYGVSLLLNNPIKQVRRPKDSGSEFLSDLLSSFAMTITNPGALLLLLGIFTFIGIDVSPNESGVVVGFILAGVFLGASLWWFSLASFINIFRNKFRLRQLLNINRISGVIIIVLGLITLSEWIVRLIP